MLISKQPTKNTNRPTMGQRFLRKDMLVNMSLTWFYYSEGAISVFYKRCDDGHDPRDVARLK